MQVKFLRVLETGEIRRIGSGNYLFSDVRIIAATNRDLLGMVQKGLFRNDLYYRLNIMPIQIPPLRERPEDIEALSYEFLQFFNKKFGFRKILSPSTINSLKQYNWPGNVRELKNTIERLVITGKSDLIDVSERTLLNFPLKPEDKASDTIGKISPAQAYSFDNPMPLKDAVATFEKQYIENALNASGGNVMEAARKIDVCRSGLYKKMKQFDIKS